MKRAGAMPIILLTPAVLFFVLFVAWPLIELVRLSLFKTDFITSRFVGLQNYIDMIKNREFRQSIINSLLYIVLLVPGQVGLALVLALCLFNLKKAWHNFSRIAFYLPVLSAGVIISQSWRWIFAYKGPVNYLLDNPVNWFGQGSTAIPVISLILSLSAFGSYLIMILAAMASIDKSIIEAAQVDGASWLRIKLQIVCPMIAPTIAMCCTLAAIAAPQIYETISFLAPYDHAASVTYQIYTQAFRLSRHGLAAAMAVCLMIVTAGLTVAKDKILCQK